jgi:hypothetical protein
MGEKNLTPKQLIEELEMLQHQIVELEIRKDGTILPVLLNATAINDSEGNYIMSRSTLFDYTECKRTEEALQESQERLELALRVRGVVLFRFLGCRSKNRTYNDKRTLGGDAGILI